MDIADFKTIFANVRPGRIAVLVDRDDPDWQTICLGVIQFLSATWGGEYALIVPTDGKTIAPLFWNILETFDPDYICSYVKTGADLRRIRPEEFEAVLDREVHSLSTELGSSNDIRENVKKALESSTITPFGNSAELNKELKDRLAPFFFENAPMGQSITALAGPSYPFTPLTKILRHSQHPNRFTVFRSDDPSMPQLWIDAITGSRHSGLEGDLTAAGIPTTEVRCTEETASDIFALLMTGKTSSLTQSIRAALGETNPQLQVADLLETPFRFSMVGVSRYRSVKDRDWERPVTVVVGATISDFALYFSLSRVRSLVSWLLPVWLQDVGDPTEKRATHPYASHFAQQLVSLSRIGANRNIAFLSASLAVAQIDAAIDVLDASSYSRGSIKGRAKVIEDIRPLLAYPLSVANTDNFSAPITQQVLEGRGVGFFPTPKPKGFTTVVPYEHRWITELAIEGHFYPRHSELGAWLVRDHRLGTDQARSGLRGICYECPNSSYFGGGDVDTILIRPQLTVPGAAEVFSILARTANWTTAVSDKGFFSRDTIRKLGGLESAARLVREAQSKSVLWQFLEGKPNPATPKPEGAVFLASDSRWYLSFKGISTGFDNDDAARRFLDTLVDNAILHRGLILKCEFCRATDWFPVSDIGDKFRCRRCRRDQRITSKHSFQQPDPVWYYQLDEIVFQGLRNDMHVPLLTLDYLRRSANSFLYTDEQEIWNSGDTRPWIEIDVCCICDGLLTVGEAKTTERIEGGGGRETRALDKYRKVAMGLGAQRFVLSTSKAWASQTLDNARKAFQDTRVEVIPLSGMELIGLSGIPKNKL